MREITAAEIIELLEEKELEASKELEKIFDREEEIFQKGKIAGYGQAIFSIKLLLAEIE